MKGIVPWSVNEGVEARRGKETDELEGKGITRPCTVQVILDTAKQAPRMANGELN